MKILMVLDHEYPPDIRVENEVDALLSAGHEVHIACYTRNNRKTEENLNGLIIHRSTISTLRYKSSVACLKFPLYFNFWRKKLTKILSQNSFDAIHIHDLPLAQIGWEMSQKFQLNFVLDLHENWPALLRISDHTNTFLGKILSTDSQWRKYELEFCNKADRVITVVEEATKRLAGLGIPTEKLLVVSNTLNSNSFVQPVSKPDPEFFTLFYAGGINRHRGLQYIIKGLKSIDNKHNVRLWLLGTGSFVDKLKRLAENEGVAEKVVFFGWKAFSEMNEMMGKADVCLIPHLKSDHTDSTIPHKIFQYMFAGKVVLASDCNPIERILNCSKSGLVYHWNDPADFAAKLSQLLLNRNEIQELSENGSKAVRANFLWESDKNRLIQMYSNLSN
jgi:glycosyltransferase involved in cell wall biosynthesis